MKKSKIETLEQYLARGGTIKVLPPKKLDNSDQTRKSGNGPAVIMSFEEADLFYGEAKKGSKPKKVKQQQTIDMGALPESLRVKFLSRLKEEFDGEIDEESFIDQDEEDDGEED